MHQKEKAVSEIIELEERLTHTFNDGWSHLDQWAPVGRAKLLSPRIIPAPNDPERYDTGPVYLFTAKLAADVDPDKGERALRDTMSNRYGSRCQHEHDCCGCMFSSVSVKRVTRRTLSVRVATHFNY